ncbi:hypothetical protein HM1_2624 [Heliomicrobium modesticaldum Ice1]|uniref:Uncharacterized protein n=1 Tax=Heliobacterium modesticaldum (strain ATCC 51547 / Ice1) TaxID=498761 RepID=B0TBE0_HELMI|nr:hypothetical protein [Heliomicrobium modesticaldum]ABZ85153.1 hypothetical protein HM1_2624 [Heliomicrobium modesticaldum Ice1]
MFDLEQLQGLLLQPFSFLYHRYDVHVMVYLRGHPEYESLEAMILLREGSDPLIWAIITLHDQSQVDHVNDERVVQQLKREGLKREIYFRTIGCRRTVEEEIARVQLSFHSYRGEPVRLDFVAASKTSSFWGGPVDPGEHARRNSLPVMFRQRSTLAGKRSRLLITGKEYAIPCRIWIPFFFTGLKGYYSEVFDLAVLRSGDWKIRLVEKPKKGVTGERWRFVSNSSEIDYVITAVSEEQLVVQSAENHLILSRRNDCPALRAFGSASHTVASGTGNFAVQFDPPLPLPSLDADQSEKTKAGIEAAPAGESQEGRFTLSIDDNELVAGKTMVREHAEGVEIRLLPDHPRWAKRRSLTITVEKQGDAFSICTSVDHG